MSSVLSCGVPGHGCPCSVWSLWCYCGASVVCVVFGVFGAIGVVAVRAVSGVMVGVVGRVGACIPLDGARPSRG